VFENYSKWIMDSEWSCRMVKFITVFSFSLICFFLIYTANAAYSEGILSGYDPHPRVFVIENISNPSGIAFNKAIGDEKHFWVVVDQSGVRGDAHLFEIILSPISHLAKVGRKINLGNAYDLEGIAISPKDFTFVLADERARDYDEKDADKRAALRRYSISGTELFSQELKEFVHQGNNGLEGVAVRANPDTGETIVYALREYLEGDHGIPEVFVYKLTDNTFVLVSSFQVDDPFNTNQSGAHYNQESGHLLIVSKTQRRILEINPDNIQNGKASVIDSLDYREFEDQHIRRKSSKYGIVEGITMDAKQNLYIILDNNDEVIGDGSSAALEVSNHPRVLVFSKRPE
jgi:hypothetical protein